MSDTAAGQPAIRTRDLSVCFLIRYHRAEVTLREMFVRLLDRLRPGEGRDSRWSQKFWALREINLEVMPGEVLGIVGRNGSGKTTLLRALAGILGPDRGTAEIRGRVGCLLSFGVGFKADLSGRENIYVNGSILGFTQREIDARLDDIIAFSELGEFIDAPVRTYSAGMKGRLGFSIAIHIDPDILLLDEVLSVGDAAFRAKAGSILNRFREQGKTVVVASHSMELIRKNCTRAVWVDRGQLQAAGLPDEICAAYQEECGPAERGARAGANRRKVS